MILDLTKKHRLYIEQRPQNKPREAINTKFWKNLEKKDTYLPSIRMVNEWIKTYNELTCVFKSFSHL
jgi:hypothetical protein